MLNFDDIGPNLSFDIFKKFGKSHVSEGQIFIAIEYGFRLNNKDMFSRELESKRYFFLMN